MSDYFSFYFSLEEDVNDVRDESYTSCDKDMAVSKLVNLKDLCWKCPNLPWWS
jgi:hypothetical protein